MRKAFGKWISLFLVVLQLILLFGVIPTSAKTINGLVSAGTDNSGWTALSELDFSTDSAVSPWSSNGNVGSIAGGELSIWNLSGNPGYLQLVLNPVVSNTLVFAADCKVSSTDRAIDMMLLDGNGSGVAVATIKNNGVDWRVGSTSELKSFPLTASDAYRSIAIIANTQDNSAAIWVDGKKLGEVPYSSYPNYTTSLKYAWVRASGSGSTSPKLKTLSMYNTGVTGAIEVEESGLVETFSASGISDASNNYFVNQSKGNLSDNYQTITYEEKTPDSGDYAIKFYTRDDGYKAPYWYVQFPNITSKSYLEFDFMMDDKPRDIPASYKRRWIRVLDVDGNKDQYTIYVDYSGKLYATGYSEDVTLATDLVSDVWYRLTFEIDLATDTADVKLARVDGEGTPQTYKGLAARNADTIVRIYYFGGAETGYNTSLWYDNIRFTKDEDATSYGTMLLYSKDSAIKVSNPFKTTATISGYMAGYTKEDLLPLLECHTDDVTISVTDSEGTEKGNDAALTAGDLVKVTHIKGAERTYTLSAPTTMTQAYLRKDDKFTASQYNCSMFFDNSVPTGSAKAIIAFYNENGNVIKVESTDITVKEGKVKVEIPVEVPSYSSYKVFVWKDFITLKPLVKN